MSRRRLLLSCVALGLLTLGAVAQKIALPAANPEAKYRQITYGPERIGAAGWKKAERDLGVGNVIFAIRPLPYRSEASYLGLGPKLAAKDAAKCLEARAYLPANEGEIIRFIEDGYHKYKFHHAYAKLAIAEPSSNPGKASKYIRTWTPTLEVTAETRKLDQRHFNLSAVDLFVGKPYDFNPSWYFWRKGKYVVVLSIWYVFTTSKIQVIEEFNEKGRIVTRKEPIMREFLVATGGCHIYKP